MGFGGGGGSDASAQARSDQQAAQARIQQGINQLNQLYAPYIGGTYNPVTPGATQRVYVPTPSSGSNVSSGSILGTLTGRTTPTGAPLQKDAKGYYYNKTGASTSGAPVTVNPNTPFLQQRATDYVNYAMPQLQQQAQKEQRQVGFDFANRGLTKSSSFTQAGQSLASEVAKQKQGIVSTGIGQSQQLAKDIAGQKSNQIAQLQMSADPQTASSQAMSSIANIQQPSVLTPIGNMLSGWMGLYNMNRQSNLMSNMMPTLASYQRQSNSLAALPNPATSVGGT